MDYRDQVGEMIENYNNDQLLRKRLEMIEFVRSETRHGQTFFYSESPSQQHLVEMIKKNKRSHRNHSRTFKQSSHLVNASRSPQESTTTPKTWANSLIFRRSRLIDNSMMNESIKLTPNNLEPHQATPKAPKRRPSLPVEQNDFHQSTKRFRHEQMYDSLSTSNSSFSDTTISRITSQIMSAKDEVSRSNFSFAFEVIQFLLCRSIRFFPSSTNVFLSVTISF